LPQVAELPARPAHPESSSVLSTSEIKTRSDWEATERDRILEALVQARWNKSKAAEALNVSRRNLYRKLARYGIEGGEED
jgi:transcriptional regulator with GAF, ATPase, and Fis domain